MSAFFCRDPLQPPFSSVGMTNNAVEGGTIRGPQRALSPQHRCILTQGSPVVREGWGALETRGRGLSDSSLDLRSTWGFFY